MLILFGNGQLNWDILKKHRMKSTAPEVHIIITGFQRYIYPRSFVGYAG